MKRNHVIASILVFALLTAVCASACASAMLPMFKQKGEVTISREEYNRLRQYEKLDMLMQLVQMYYYDDVDTS